jgi:DNA-binding NarL/FixJ family response regulator
MTTSHARNFSYDDFKDSEHVAAPARRTDSPVRVFLIEDHPVVREGTRRLLEADNGAAVVGEADSGEDAMTSPSLGLAEVVLCDVMLPGMDGIETTKAILGKYPHLRVVMLSSFGDSYLSAALEAGACGYLLKRSKGDELLRAVRDAAAGGAPLSPALNALLVNRYRELQQSKSDSMGLSERQAQVLEMVARGETTKKIAEVLFLSPATVKRELRHVFDLMGVNNRAHAVAEAQRRGLI